MSYLLFRHGVLSKTDPGMTAPLPCLDVLIGLDIVDNLNRYLIVNENELQIFFGNFKTEAAVQ